MNRLDRVPCFEAHTGAAATAPPPPERSLKSMPSPIRRTPMAPANEAVVTGPASPGRENDLLEAATLAREWIIEASARPGALPVSATLQRLNGALGQYAR